MEVKSSNDDLGEVEKKEFKPKFDVERLSDYGEKPDESFWGNVNQRHWQEVNEREGGIDHRRLRELAEGYPFPGTLEKVVKDLKEGARLGVKQDAFQC